MSEVERKQDNPSQDRQKADARILGQILAAQNVVFALPDTIRIAEFYAQILISIPGITACRVCLRGKSVQAGEMASGVCAECETLRHLAREEDSLIPTTSVSSAIWPIGPVCASSPSIPISIISVSLSSGSTGCSG